MVFPMKNCQLAANDEGPFSYLDSPQSGAQCKEEYLHVQIPLLNHMYLFLPIFFDQTEAY